MVRPRSVNIVEVAKRAKVSTASVSRVLNNQSGVSESLRGKIRKILEDDGVFSSHVSQRGVKIAVVIEMYEPAISAYISTILAGIAGCALREGIDIAPIFLNLKHREDFDVLEAVRQRNCDGVIFLFSGTVNPGAIETLLASKIAVFMLANRCENEAVGFINTDPEEGMVAAVTHLRDLGHREIAFLTGLCENVYDNTRRAEVFAGMVVEGSGRSREDYVAEHYPTIHAQESGYQQALEILRRNPKITAMITNNDEMAYGAILACYERKLSVPGDLSILGFDDYPSSSFMVPPLTTVRQHLELMGREAVTALDDYVCGKISRLPRKILRPELIVRKSTCGIHNED